MTYQATIKLGEKILFENLAVDIFEQRASASSPLTSWSGGFAVPDTQEGLQGFIEYRKARRDLFVEISDGRKGEIVTTHISGLGGGADVSFQGSGPLR